MKNLSLIFFILIMVACNNSSSKNKKTEDASKSTQKATIQEPKSSADYSSLLTNFKCNMTIAELAKVLEVSETDISIPDNDITTIYEHCLFSLKGFGKNTLGEDSQLRFGPSPSTKSMNKKEIKSYLERKKEGLKIMGMDIELSETGDFYLAYQPAHGRLLLLNENQSKFFFINYGQKSSQNNRSKEQHEALRLKMTDLANYLLKKHRK